MREIKFRAWDTNREEMVTEGAFIQVSGEGGYFVYHEDETVWEADDHIILQYIGLEDKDGKEIYEGDICRVTEPDTQYHDGFEYVGDVRYAHNRFYVHCPEYHPEFRVHQYEVIGNLYENPKLISN